MSVDTTAAVHIRAAVPGDLSTCAALDHTTHTDYVWQMAHSDENGALSVSFRPVRLPRTMRVLYPRSGAALKRSWDLNACFLVAEVGHQVVGYINMGEQRAQETGWVIDLVVEPKHRGQGVGARLLTHARAWARERELQRIIVETATKNYPAICFLQKCGLVFCGYNDLYYPNRDIALFFGQSLR